MRSPRFHSLLLGIVPALTVLPIPVQAAVTVSFVEPSRYNDADDSSGNPLRTMLELETHLKGLGDRYLGPGETLRIEVLNIDLAGRVQSFRGTGWGVRFLNGDADWPRIELRYTLESKGNISKPVQETIADMAYLRRVDREYSSVSLPYEKRMLDEWFKARFVEHRPPR